MEDSFDSFDIRLKCLGFAVQYASQYRDFMGNVIDLAANFEKFVTEGKRPSGTLFGVNEKEQHVRTPGIDPRKADG